MDKRQFKAITGREVAFYRVGDNYPRVCAVSKRVRIQGKGIDVTQDCDDGIHRAANRYDRRRITMRVQGILTSNVESGHGLDAETEDLTDDYQIVVPGLGTIAGRFQAEDVEFNGAIDEAVKIQATFRSTGPWTWMPQGEDQEEPPMAFGAPTFYADFIQQDFYKTEATT